MMLRGTTTLGLAGVLAFSLLLMWTPGVALAEDTNGDATGNDNGDVATDESGNGDDHDHDHSHEHADETEDHGNHGHTHHGHDHGHEAAPEPAPNPSSDNDFRLIWRNGVRLQSDDILVRIGGRLHFDAGFGFSDLDDDPSGHAYEPRDEYRVRRARLDLRGTFFDVTHFRLQVELTGGDNGVSFADAYVGFDVGPGRLLIGQHTTPFSIFSFWTNDYLMMEAPFTMQLFGAGREIGLRYGMNVADDMIGIALGFYRLSTGFGTTPNPNEWLLAARVWASLMNDDDDSDLHLGLSFTQVILQNAERTFGTRGVIRTGGGGNIIQRATDPLDGISLLGFEAAFLTGGLRILAEFAGNITNPAADGADNDFLWAISATVGFILTEGSQRYNTGNGYSPNPSVANPVGRGGVGVIEAVMQFDYGDLSDNLDNGAGATGLQVGLGANWYLNNNMRIMLNFALVSADDDGTYFLMGTRFQFNF